MDKWVKRAIALLLVTPFITAGGPSHYLAEGTILDFPPAHCSGDGGKGCLSYEDIEPDLGELWYPKS